MVWVALALTTVALNIATPQPFGLSALGAIFEPYLLFSALLAGSVALRSPGWVARVLVLALIVVALGRYLPGLTSFPPEPGTEPLRVSTWNVLAGEDAIARALQGISASRADLIALQEIEADVAAQLTSEATGFQFRAMEAHDDSDVALLSRFPILESQPVPGLPALRAVVDWPSADPVVVYVAHPPLAEYVRLGDIPVGVDFNVRDTIIGRLRGPIDEDLAAGRSVVVMGDFNTTERERAYGWLSDGLRDAHLDAGTGPGFTWRPSPLMFMPVGVLRIDYVLSSPDLAATAATVDCSLPSDHCRVDVELVREST